LASANIVGYVNKDVRRGMSQQACTFDQIGVTGGALDIQKLIPVDNEGDYIGDGDVTIQFYTYVGKFEKAYCYYGENEFEEDRVAGWYDENEGELADYTFVAGEGFKLSAATAGYLRFPEM
jgi:hypothetical protein